MKLNDNKKIKIKQKQVLIYIYPANITTQNT